MSGISLGAERDMLPLGADKHETTTMIVAPPQLALAALEALEPRLADLRAEVEQILGGGRRPAPDQLSRL